MSSAAVVPDFSTPVGERAVYSGLPAPYLTDNYTLVSRIPRGDAMTRDTTRTRRTAAVLLVGVALVGLTGVVTAAPTPVRDAPVASGPHADDAAQTAQQRANESFDVTSVSAGNTTVGGITTVTAEILNSGDAEATQRVELRYRGELVQRTSVRLPANGSTTVNFTFYASPQLLGITSGGQWVPLTVQTRTNGALTYFYVENATAGNESASGSLPRR